MSIEKYRDVHKDIIQRRVDEAYENGHITKEEFENISPFEATEGRAYDLPKAHKAIPEGRNIPNLRSLRFGIFRPGS